MPLSALAGLGMQFQSKRTDHLEDGVEARAAFAIRAPCRDFRATGPRRERPGHALWRGLWSRQASYQLRLSSR